MDSHMRIRQLQNVLRLRQVGDLTLTETAYAPGKWSTTHAHENAHFIFVLQGTFNEVYGSRTRYCSPYTFISRPPGEEHSEEYHPNKVICIVVDIETGWMERLEEYSIRLQTSIDLRDGA